MISKQTANLLTAVFVLSTTACQPHVTLALPAADASFAVRTAAYEKMRPATVHTTEIIAQNVVENSSRHTDYLDLANGTRVYHPEDLLAVLPSDSAIAQKIDSYQTMTTVTLVLAAAAVACLGVGGGLAAAGLSKHSEPDKSLIIPGIGVALVGIGLFIGAQAAGNSAADDASAAYIGYDLALQQRLQVCVEPGCHSEAQRAAR